VAAAGSRAAFAANALAFCVSALLLGGLPRLAPERAGRRPAGLLAETARGLGYVARTPAPRALFCGLLLLVSFAAVDNVALVFLVGDVLGGGAGALATAAQAGSAIAYVAAAPLLGMLSPGVVLVAAGAGVLLTLAVLVPPLRRAAHRPVEVENGSAAPVDP
jgi:hypothetical protein